MATLLRLPAVVERTGLSRASVYLHVNKGTMTRPIKIGERSVAWDSAEIDAINAARIAGKPEWEIQSLVRQLHKQRENAA